MPGDKMTTVEICLLSVLGILAFATLLSIFLLKKSPHSETFKKVKVIVKSWWYIALPVLGALYLGPLALMALFYTVTCFGLYEFVKSSRFKDIKWALVGIFVASTSLQYLAIYLHWNILFYSMIPLIFIFALPTLVILRKDTTHLPNLTALLLGGLLISYYLSHIPAVTHLDLDLWKDQEQSIMAVLLLIFTTELNDVMQFIFGKAFGKNKIVPSISPNKTEAGFIGGLLGSIILWSFIGPFFIDVNAEQGAMIGAFISVVGILGDLMFSALKRYYGVKDFSDLIPGHGGLLDRLDSLILTAPVFFHLIRLTKVGIL